MNGNQEFDGICYLSRLGDEFTNWAIFESEDASTSSLITAATCEPLVADDVDFHHALELLGLIFVGVE